MRPPCSDDRLSDAGEELMHERAVESAERVASRNSEGRHLTNSALQLLTLFSIISMVLSLMLAANAAYSGDAVTEHLVDATAMYVLAVLGALGSRATANPDF